MATRRTTSFSLGGVFGTDPLGTTLSANAGFSEVPELFSRLGNAVGIRVQAMAELKG